MADSSSPPASAKMASRNACMDTHPTRTLGPDPRLHKNAFQLAVGRDTSRIGIGFTVGETPAPGQATSYDSRIWKRRRQLRLRQPAVVYEKASLCCSA